MGEWQPIESAPKDREILLWEGDSDCAVVGRHNPSYTEEWHATVHGEFAPWSDFDRPPIFNATHWMPLPDPPK